MRYNLSIYQQQYHNMIIKNMNQKSNIMKNIYNHKSRGDTCGAT